MKPVSRGELKCMVNNGQDIILVEVLDAADYQRFHLPGAINVPMDESFDERIQDAVPDKTRRVVVYCLNPETDLSRKAGRRMDELGYTQVHDYEPGKMDWKLAGLPVVSG